MFGLFIYTFCSIGLGGLFPSPLADRRVWLGLAGFAGFCAIGILIFVLNTLAGVGLSTACNAVFALSVAGWLRLARRLGPTWRTMLFHPAVVLIAAGIGVAAWRGGIGYLPYSGDEFSQWIGAARAIFVAGGYPEAFNLVTYPGYTPGWALTLLFPMVPGGVFDEGLAATAPFVMYVFLLGFIYEAIIELLGRYTALDEILRRLYAWMIVMVLITIEINGHLVSVNLLIEPAQIYTGSAIFLLLFLMFEVREKNLALPLFIGVICLASYLYKMAALTLAPSLAVSALAIWWLQGRQDGADGFKRALPFALVTLAVMVGPMVLVHLIWKTYTVSSNCLASPFALLQGDRLQSLLSPENLRMTDLFGVKLWGYVSTYKWPVSLIAGLGLVVGMFRSRYWPVIIAFGFYFVAMELAFYMVMAICGHWQYMTTERYTRVLLQPAHVLGAVVIFAMVLRRIQSWHRDGFYRILTQRAVRVGVGVFIGVLFVWQIVSMDRAFEDLENRRVQKIDSRHFEMRKAMALVAGTIAQGKIKTPSNQVPKILLIDDYWEDLSHGLATYHALGTRMGAGGRFAEVVIWNRQTTLDTKTDLTVLGQALAQADGVWPVRLPTNIASYLGPYLDGESCGGDVQGRFLIRISGERLRFGCSPKKSAD